MRRGSIVALLGIALVAGGVAVAIALVPRWLPEAASREAGRIHFVFWFVIAICIFIFAIVAAVMVYAVARFRVHEDDFEDGPPVHGHTGLEITWTVIPFVLVTAIAIVSAIVLSRNDAQAGNTLRINVMAQQFAFTFGYPDAKNATSPVLRLPEGRSVELYLRSLDVIHSVFVPQFSQKIDAVPGLVTRLHITPTRLGTFPLECTELCGLGHSLMRSQAIVMKPAAFDAWLRQQAKSASPSPPASTGTTSTTQTTTSTTPSASAGLSFFNSNGCSSCHTLSTAGATGKVGPDLDNLVAYARQAKQPLAGFVRESIVNPDAYVQPGYHKGLMPTNFGHLLTKTQLGELVGFLVQSAQKSGKQGQSKKG
ncbi:MAG TPA: cytochrome c oxidase subunit II [Gaiellaceae bacterium]|nr:cytochrome c oxidase subunit II [Gaiellaceae bacterium]